MPCSTASPPHGRSVSLTCLEVIEIDHHDREIARETPRTPQFLLGLREEIAAVVNAGQRIRAGLVEKLRFQLLALRDVVERHHDWRRAAVIHRDRRHLGDEFAAAWRFSS